MILARSDGRVPKGCDASHTYSIQKTHKKPLTEALVSTVSIVPVQDNVKYTIHKLIPVTAKNKFLCCILQCGSTLTKYLHRYKRSEAQLIMHRQIFEFSQNYLWQRRRWMSAARRAPQSRCSVPCELAELWGCAESTSRLLASHHGLWAGPPSSSASPCRPGNAGRRVHSAPLRGTSRWRGVCWTPGWRWRGRWRVWNRLEIKLEKVIWNIIPSRSTA